MEAALAAWNVPPSPHTLHLPTPAPTHPTLGVPVQLRAEAVAVAAASGEGEAEDEGVAEAPPSLPMSILANKEPFKGGDWRKTPYAPRCEGGWACVWGEGAHTPARTSTHGPSAHPDTPCSRCPPPLLPPRPYTRLSEYAIVEPEMKDIILRKLSTQKQGGCGGEHCATREQLGRYR